jgi:DHA1 family tetracycline resistance protein-like MFS transporter
METPFNVETATAVPSKPAKGALAFIFVVALLDIIGLTILLPVQAYIVREYSSDALAVSMLTVIYAAAQFVCAPILGRLSDRYGRRPVLLISVLGSAFGYFLFGIGGALWVLFLSRLIDGITGGNISTATAYVADVTLPQDRAKNFALIGIAFGLGFVLGPALGGALSQISLAAPAYAAGTLSLLSAIVGFVVLPESLPRERRTAGVFTWREINPLAALFTMLRRPTLGLLLLVWCLFQFAFTGNNSIMALFMIDKFSALPVEIAILFVVGGVANAVVQGGLIGRLAPKFGEQRLVLASLALQALGAIGIVIAPTFWLLYPIIVLSSAATALIWPTMGALTANQVPSHEQGQVAGVSAALGSLMSVFGPLWAGAVYDQFAPAAPYWSGAIVFVLAVLVLACVRVGGAHAGSAVPGGAADRA